MYCAHVLLLMLVLPPASWAELRLPGDLDVGIPIEIPGLEGFGKEEPPITTSIKDAVTEIPFLDAFDPQRVAPLSLVPRGPDGTLTLLPGLWDVTLQSYCLHAGAYAPSGGDGYAYAPLQGPQAGVIQTILRNSVHQPEIPQEDIQALIWAILARTKIADLSADQQRVAEQLLTAEQIDKLNGGAIGKIPPEVLSRAMGKLPPFARQVFEAEARLRDLFTSGAAVPYAQLEQVAVLQGDPEPPKGSREVPRGRWSYHPAGFFVRYMPSGYSETRTQFYVPEKIEVQTDDLGRITTIADPGGCRIETEYDEGVAALTFNGDASVKGYAFRSIRVTAPDPEKAGQMRQMEYTGTGWTLVGIPSGRGRPAPGAGEAYSGAADRYQWAVTHTKQLRGLNQALAKLAGAPKPAERSETLAAILNLAHYAAALKAVVPVTGEATEGQAEPRAAEGIGLIYRAWQTRVAAIEPAQGAPTTEIGSLTRPRVHFVSYQVAQRGRASLERTRGLPWFDPSDNTASPGNTGRQRLAQSGRKAGRGGDDPIARARKGTRFLSTGTSVAWRVGTGAGTPWGIPSLGVQKILNFNFDAWSRSANALAGDPPRDDFNLIATAELPALAPVQAGGGVSPAIAQAMNAFLEAAYNLTAQLRAAVICRDRMGGALRAGSDEWGGRQATALVGAQRQAGQAMLLVADRLEALLGVLDDEGVEDFEVTEDAVTAYYNELRATGFRPDEVEVAHSLGLTDAKLQESLSDRLSFEASEMSGSLRAGAEEAAAALRELGEELALLPAQAPD